MLTDIGEVDGPWGSNYFIEACGFGVFAATMLNIHERNGPIVAAAVCREDELNRVLGILKEQLDKHRPKKLSVHLDDQDLSDDYVLIEALNIRYAGPNLDLAPDADTNDGLLDVALLRRGQENKLGRYLTHCLRGRNAKANLPVHKGRHLVIEWDGSPVHIDDNSNVISIEIGAHSVMFLCPQKIKRRPRRRRDSSPVC